MLSTRDTGPRGTNKKGNSSVLDSCWAQVIRISEITLKDGWFEMTFRFTRALSTLSKAASHIWRRDVYKLAHHLHGVALFSCGRSGVEYMDFNYP